MPSGQFDRRDAKALARYAGFAPPDLRVLVEQARASGYAFNEGRIVTGMSAVGVPILNHNGRPTAALSCAAISSRMQFERRAEIVSLLHAEAAAIAKRFSPRSVDQGSGDANAGTRKQPVRAEG